jgi:hypothetical protein
MTEISYCSILNNIIHLGLMTTVSTALELAWSSILGVNALESPINPSPSYASPHFAISLQSEGNMPTHGPF